MENNEKNLEANVTNQANGIAIAEAKPTETLGDKITKSWFWKNRGKIGVAVGAALAFVVGSLLGNGGNDETNDNSTTIDDD